MNVSKLTPLLVAAICITAFGVSATTLESSLTTDPDEEIDPPYQQLPIGEEDAAQLQEQMDGSNDEGDGGEDDRSTSDAASSSSETSSGGEGLGMGAVPPDLLDWLLSLLVTLVRFLLSVAVVFAAAALAYRHRRRIVDAFWSLLMPDDDPADLEYDERKWPAETPSNVVERAWVRLVEEVDPERPSLMTPSESAAAARDAGLDEATVETITAAFERVEYGGVSVDVERERVEAALEDLSGGRSGYVGRGRRTRGGGR